MSGDNIYIKLFSRRGCRRHHRRGKREKERSVSDLLKVVEVCVGCTVCSCWVRDGSPKGQDLRLYAWLDSRQRDPRHLL